MALTYQIDCPNALVTITGEYATPDEWVALLTAVMRDAQFRSGFNFIRDIRGSMPPARAETVFEVQGVIQQFWDRLQVHRAALVTDKTILRQAYALGVEHGLRGLPVRAFARYDDAIRWLQESERESATAGSGR